MVTVDSPTAVRPASRLPTPAPRPVGAGLPVPRARIRPPRLRAETLLERPGLQARLHDALCTQRLVLLSAAAGCGKTTALAQALAQMPAGIATAWISVDRSDDLGQLLQCLLAALDVHRLPWRIAPQRLLEMAEDGGAEARSMVAVEIVNALDACAAPHGVIAFDDLQRLDDGPSFEFLDLLLERLSPDWTIAIATRHDPPLSLSRLHVWGEVAEFRRADLALQRDEVITLARSAGLAQADAVALHTRTAGWVTGVRLALAAGAAGDRALFDFLSTEVLDPLEPALRRFLMQLSVLRRITVARAAAVTGHAHAAFLLEAVERLDLFVSVDDDGDERALRLHEPFREALAQRLQRDHPQQWTELCRRAAAVEVHPCPPGDGHQATTDPDANDATEPAPTAAAGLTQREAEVLAHMAAGDSNKHIARALALSPHTVKRHVANILDKLGAASRGQAAAWYLTQS